MEVRCGQDKNGNDKVDMIFRHEYDGRTYYSIGMSKRNMEDTEWIKGSITCKFKKDVDVPNQSKIIIKGAWLDFYKKDKETVPYVFINDFEYVDKKEDSHGISSPIEIDDDDLPF